MKAKKIKKSPELSIISGLPSGKKSGYLILHSENLDEEHSILAIINENEIYGYPVPVQCTEIIIFDEYPVFLGEYGHIWSYNELNLDIKSILEDVESPLRDISYNGEGNVIVVGSLNQIFESKDLINWNISIGPTISKPTPFYGLEAVDSFPHEETYAVGWGGECLVKLNGTWTATDLSTNLDLYNVLCSPEHNVYICGDEGLLINGRLNQWNFISNEVTSEKLWGLAYFKSRIFVSDMYNIYEVIDNHLANIQYNKSDSPPPLTYKLMTYKDKILWSIGEKHLYIFDGYKWSCLLNLE